MGKDIKQKVIVEIDMRTVAGKKKLSEMNKSLTQSSVATRKLMGYVTKQNEIIKKATSLKRGLAAKNKILTDGAKKHGVSIGRISKAMSSQGLEFTKTGRVVDKTGKSIKNFNKQIKTGIKATGKFNMNALGIMFAGMAIQRVFVGISRAAVGSFTKIMESNKMMGTAVQQAAVGFEFLKFSIGSAINTALGPLLPALMNILSRMSEWIQKNPELTSKIILWGLVLGTVLFVVGQFSLGLGSLAAQLGKVSIAGLGTWSVLGLIGVVLIGVIAALGLMNIASGKTERKWHTTTGNMTKDTLGYAKDIVVSMGAIIFTIGNFIGVVLYSIGQAIVGTIKFIINSFKLAFNDIKALINDAIDTWNEFFDTDIKKFSVYTKVEEEALKATPNNFQAIENAWAKFGKETSNLLNKPEVEELADVKDEPMDTLDQETIDMFNNARNGVTNIDISQTNNYSGIGYDEQGISDADEKLKELAQEIKGY